MDQVPISFQEIKTRLDEIEAEVKSDGICLDRALALYDEAVRLGLSACDLSEEDTLAFSADVKDLPTNPKDDLEDVFENLPEEARAAYVGQAREGIGRSSVPDAAAPSSSDLDRSTDKDEFGSCIESRMPVVKE